MSSLNSNKGNQYTPYKGLMPYSEEDAPFFFGRERWCRIIADNLMASRLTLLYGASGVGKSSVLRAGVASRLHQVAQQNLKEFDKPELAVVLFKSWRDDPLVGLKHQVKAEIERILGSEALKPVPESCRLDKTLQAWTELIGKEDRVGKLLIILDQFEDYFLYHPHEDGEGTFAIEFPRAVNAPDLQANFLISIRADALDKLDRFKGRISNLFDNYLRINHLDEKSALDAIRKPIKEYNHRQKQGVKLIGIEPELIKEVLKQIKIGEVSLGANGRGGIDIKPINPSEIKIETPYLQLVMERLWQEEMKAGSNRLRLETLTQLGGAERIVKHHLNEGMSLLSKSEQEAAARVFQYLVTPGGTKIAYPALELVEPTGLDQRQLEDLLEKLASGRQRIVRPIGPSPDQPNIQRYEIFHDVLAQSILDWRKQYLKAKEIKEQLTKWINWSLGVGAVLIAGCFLLWNSLEAKKIMWAEREVSSQLDSSSKLQALEKLMTAQQNWNNRSFIKDFSSFLEPIKDFQFLIIDEPPNIPELQATLEKILADIREQNQFQVSGGEVWSASFSPDGQKLAAASTDGTISLWDLEGHPISDPFQAHEEPVWSVSFSPDGQKLATASRDKTVRLWNLKGKMLAEFKGHTGAVWSISFSPDGKILASASADKTVQLWNLDGNEIAKPFEGHEDRIRSVSFSPDGKQLASASEDGTVRLWDLQGNQIGDPFQDDKDPVSVYSVSFSPDGQKLASASKDGTIRLWNLEGKMLDEFKDHNTPIWSVSFSPDGQQLATASQDGTVRLLNLQDRQWAVLKGHNSPVYSVSFSRNGKHLASSSADKTIRLWDWNRKPLRRKFTSKDKIWGVSYIPPERQQLVISSNDGYVRLWNLKNDKIHKSSAYNSAVISLSLSPDGQHLASGYSDGKVRLWNLQGNQLDELQTIPAHEDWVWGVSFSPDGQHLATGSSDGYVRLWNLKGKPLAEFSNNKEVWDVKFSHDQDHQYLAIASADGNIHLCKLQDNILACEKKLEAHEGSVWSVSFSPNGSQLASASADGTFKLWDLQDNSPPKEFLVKEVKDKDSDEDEKVEVYSISFSQDGKKLATASRNGTVRIWDLRGNLLAKFQSQGEVRSLSFSSKDEYLAIASDDGTVELWLTEDFEQLLERGCDWLEDYLAAHPERQEKLTICQDN